MDKDRQYNPQGYNLPKYETQETPSLLVRPENNKRFSPLEIDLNIFSKPGVGRRNIGKDGVVIPLTFVNDSQFVNALLDYIGRGNERDNKKEGDCYSKN